MWMEFVYILIFGRDGSVFSVKGQIVNIFSFVRNVVSVKVSCLTTYNAKAAIDDI